MNTIQLLFLLASFSSAPLLRAAEVPPSQAGQAPAYRNIGIEDYDKLRADKKNVLLDVRTPEEFAAGHIPGAINLDWNSPDFAKKVAELDKGKTYLVNCAAGGRSAKACGAMNKLNFTHCYNLEGGFKAWDKAGKPVEKPVGDKQ